jgi:hypothetical protein
MKSFVSIAPLALSGFELRFEMLDTSKTSTFFKHALLLQSGAGVF